MSKPQLYSVSDMSNMGCEYARTLHAASPSNLSPRILEYMIDNCNLTSQQIQEITEESQPSGFWFDNRQPLTTFEVHKFILDPWAAWDFSGDQPTCNINTVYLDDIFGSGQYNVNSATINPVVNTTGFDEDQLYFIKAMGGLHHYFFARTYYIDLCYGTQKYLDIYYNSSKDNFIQDHIADFSAYVDTNTGLIKGDKLLIAWSDINFRSSINILEFIRPLVGKTCEEFSNWTNSSWWTETKDWTGDWNDDLNIGISSNLDPSGAYINIHDSKLITTYNNTSFPGYRISINELYNTITYPESDDLSALFGNNLLKGPSGIANLDEYYNPTCNIEFNWEDTGIEPTGIIPYTIDIITDISVSNNYLYAQYDKIDAFDVPVLITSTINLCTECNNTGTLLPEVIESEETNFNIEEPPCFKTIDVVTDVFIEDLNFRVTKSTIKIISITSVNNDNNIIAVSSCDNSTYSSTPVSYTISECANSIYNDYEYIMPTEISCVTDIYVENNYLKQRKCTIIVPNKVNINPETINLIPLNNNCTNNG